MTATRPNAPLAILAILMALGAGELVGASEVFARFRWQPPPAGR
ncbi:MAG: hypothetical protein PHQ53_04260 [Candidatus Krumholzibacteria bacterium]|nr:hypothetical protein [Candidatus Krumholzibacteria bacterium]